MLSLIIVTFWMFYKYIFKKNCETLIHTLILKRQTLNQGLKKSFKK